GVRIRLDLLNRAPSPYGRRGRGCSGVHSVTVEPLEDLDFFGQKTEAIYDRDGSLRTDDLG
ncbi:hypothetical protein, partial [Escherichia coli]|uniref:hypothetical protein n=1 Tax=Escherichia coli TaxID=562 RepID=UPI0019547B0B